MRIFLMLLVFVSTAYGNACRDNDFECANGDCIAGYRIWDGKDDCGDNSDEYKCPPCKEFTCSNGKCVRYDYMCDGDDDCHDMSDEIDPITGECPECPPEKAFLCANGKCIHRGWKCDNDNDCGDWSDELEELCPCDYFEVRCSRLPGDRKTCLPAQYVCDGIWDCYYGEDETNCTRSAGFKREPYRKVPVKNLKHDKFRRASGKSQLNKMEKILKDGKH